MIECESAEIFNSAIREAGEAVAALDSKGHVPLRDQFAQLDLNNDGRLSRSELLSAFGWRVDSKDSSGGQLAAHTSQLDDLLGIINTDGEVRVNGEASISEPEFKAWLGKTGGC